MGVVTRGNGIASYYKEDDVEVESHWETTYQITKLSTSVFDIINVYFKDKSTNSFLSEMNYLLTNPEKTIILGDFNIDYLKQSSNQVVSWFEARNFVQIIQKPTHIKGGLIDHFGFHHIYLTLSITISKVCSFQTMIWYK